MEFDEAYNWPGWLNWLWSEYRTLSQKNPKTNEDNRRMDVIRTSFSEKSGGIEIEDIIKREDIITGLRENAITDNNPKLASDLRKLWDQILFFKNEDIFYSTLYWRWINNVFWTRYHGNFKEYFEWLIANNYLNFIRGADILDDNTKSWISETIEYETQEKEWWMTQDIVRGHFEEINGSIRALQDKILATPGSISDIYADDFKNEINNLLRTNIVDGWSTGWLKLRNISELKSWLTELVDEIPFIERIHAW